MPITKPLNLATTGFVASVWAFSGLFCKVLNWIPRHRQIVTRILGQDHSVLWTRLIGIGEICLALWILTGVKSRFCAVLQIVLILAMNAIEITCTSDLLLFGRWNAVFAVLFSGLIYGNEFLFCKNPKPQTSVWVQS